MDINFPLPKDQGCFECADIIDRISKLPDEILAKILSCLSTKESVATSILSKRWEHLWTLTSDLDFSAHWLDEYEAEDTNENGCMIPELSLSLNRFESQSRTYSQLPRRLYSCDTLVVLRICGDFVIDLPTFVCFPCLKLLKIAYVVFVDDTSMERLLSSCPVLEELTVVSLKDCLEIMNISVPSLKRLYILANKIPTKINTPCLEYLEIIHRPEDPPSRYFVNFTSSLVHAKLHGLDISLLNAVSQVENLVLTANDESLQNIIRDSVLPIFKNLKTLKLLFACSTPMDREVLANLLHSSPNLQALIFPEGLVHFAFCGDFLLPSWQWSEFVPECLSTHLKTIEIFEFVGFPWEIELVGYLLKSAKVLEKMIIHKFLLSKHPTTKKKLSKNLSDVWSLLSNCSSSEIMRSESCSSSCEIIFTD